MLNDVLEEDEEKPSRVRRNHPRLEIHCVWHTLTNHLTLTSVKSYHPSCVPSKGMMASTLFSDNACSRRCPNPLPWARKVHALPTKLRARGTRDITNSYTKGHRNRSSHHLNTTRRSRSSHVEYACRTHLLPREGHATLSPSLPPLPACLPSSPRCLTRQPPHPASRIPPGN